MSTATQADLIEKLKQAKRVATPLVAINTPDQPGMCDSIAKELSDVPVVAWDFVRGIYAKNEEGKSVVGAIGTVAEDVQRDPIAALKVMFAVQDGTVLIYYNAHRFVQDAGVCQGLLNLRDHYKAKGCMAVLLGTGITLPAEIASDVVQWTEPLPDDARLLTIVSQQVAFGVESVREQDKEAGDAMQKAIGAELVRKAAQSLKGTSAFGAEQLLAMSLRRTGLDLDTLNTQARALIEQTPGLHFERGHETFSDIGGLEFAKTFGKRLFDGPKAPTVVVRIEELEKAMAGAKGDLSGTSGDALQVLLSEMEDNDYSGMLAFGCPGAGKSLFSKAMANTYGAKGIVFDINSCKGSLVGQSERQIRQAMAVIRTLAGGRAFFVASVNALDTIPAALQRRFRVGTWFFDLPSAAERKQIWALQRKKYGISNDDQSPDEEDLSGADIRNIAEMASTLKCSLAEARRYTVPLKIQSPADIKNARAMANGKFTDAGSGGVYEAEKVAKAGGRKMQVQ